MASWAREAATTIRDYATGFSDQTIRMNKLTALMEQRGRITYNHGGDDFDWAFKYNRANLQSALGENPRTFTRTDRFKRPTLGWRGYEMTDAMYKLEKEKNKGKPALIKYFSMMAKELLKDMRQALAEEGYQDGDGSGNSHRWHGFDSFTAATQTITQGTAGAVARTANALDKYGYPNDTYAGLSTVLGTFGGSQTSGTWPNGKCQPSFDAWTPVIVNVSSSAWSKTSGTTWETNCDEAVRESLIHGQRNKAVNGQVNAGFLDREWYAAFLDKVDTKERIQTSSKLGMRALGFEDVFNYDGVEFTYEYSVPAEAGYGFNIQDMELRCMTSQLIETEGPEYDINTRSWKVAVSHLGNLVFGSPRNYIKWLEIA